MEVYKVITVALDASTTCTGWSVFSDGVYVDSGSIDLKKDRDIEHRTTIMTKKICQVIKLYEPDKVFLEDTAKMTNVSTLKSLCWLAGGIKFWCHIQEYPIELVMPSAWRTHVGIQEYGAKRAALKKKAISLCKELLAINADEDRAEAILINVSMLIRDGVIPALNK